MSRQSFRQKGPGNFSKLDCSNKLLQIEDVNGSSDSTLHFVHIPKRDRTDPLDAKRSHQPPVFPFFDLSSKDRL